MLRITVGFLTASLVALMFMALTGFILFDDVINHAAPITIKHAGTLGVLVAVAYFGDRIWPEFRRMHIVTAFGCVLLFTAGLAMCVVLSSGRNAAVTINKNADARKANENRETLQGALTSATTSVEAAQAAVTEAQKAVPKALAEVAHFCPGKECSSKRRTLKDAREEVSAASKRLADTNERYYQAYGQFSNRPAEAFENADLKGSAAVFAKLPFVTAREDTIEATMALAIPFFQSLMAEIALLVGLSIARGYAHEFEALRARKVGNREFPQFPRLSPPATVNGEITIAEPETVPAPSPAYYKAKREKPTDVQLVLTALEKAGRPVSNEELAGILSCSPGESSKRVQNCGNAVIIGRNGRCYAIQPNYAMV